MLDIYENEIQIGDIIIYESDKFYTRLATVTELHENSIIVLVEDCRKQLFNRYNKELKVVVVGKFIKDMSEMKIKCTTDKITI